MLGVLLVNVKNTGLLGGTKRRILNEGRRRNVTPAIDPTTSHVRCHRCPSRPLGPHVDGPVLRKQYLITGVSRIPYAVRLPSDIVKTRRSKTLPLGALTGTVLTGGSRVQRVTTVRCRRRTQRDIIQPEKVR